MPAPSSGSPGHPTGQLSGTTERCKPSCSGQGKREKSYWRLRWGWGVGGVGAFRKTPTNLQNHIELLPKEYAGRLRLIINYWAYSCLSSLPFCFHFSTPFSLSSFSFPCLSLILSFLLFPISSLPLLFPVISFCAFSLLPFPFVQAPCLSPLLPPGVKRALLWFSTDTSPSLG